MGHFSRKFLSHLGIGLLSCAAWSSTLSAEEGWTRFRGPNGSGVSTETDPTPTTWSATENLKWKVPLPGPGSSSPIIVGDKIFVTCWSGYGVEGNEDADQSKLKRHLICLDKTSGKIIWDKSVPAALPEDDYGGMFAEHGYASHTPVSDGKNVYVFFGKSGALAFDLEGKQLWQTKVGDGLDGRRWGSSSSPVLYKNLLIVTASAESQAIVGLDKETGKEVWRAEADGLASTWGTPVLVELEGDNAELVIGVPYEFWGMNPNTGKLT
jgi:outer membrane protein assembly factor BamB